jgi:hypothetical protein
VGQKWDKEVQGFRTIFYIFPVGSVYYVKFRDPVTRQLLSKKSTGFRNKTLARQWAKEEWERRAVSAGKTDMLLCDYARPFFTGEGCPMKQTCGTREGILP